MTAKSLSEAVADWLVDLRWADVPESARLAIRDGVLQSVAGGVAGLDMPETRIALDIARRAGEPGPSTIFGAGLKAPESTAVLVNSAMFCALEQQEMHVASGSHPYQTIVPVALTLAEAIPVSGEQFLTAVIAGTEAMLALAIVGLSIAPEWGMESSHASAIYGGIGAAATAAKMMGLDRQRTAWALGHAAHLGAGLTEGLWAGTTEYHWSLANAGRVGHLAAQLARSGAETARLIFEGPAGFYHRFSELAPADLARHDFVGLVEARLGKIWECEANIFKRYPVHFNNLAFVDAAKALRARHHIAPGDIRAIRLTINRWCELCDGANLGPYHGREATRGATAFGVAMMLSRGRYSLEDAYDHAAPDVARLVGKTTIRTFEDPREARDWRSLRIEIDAPDTHVYDGKTDGVPDYRLTNAELRAIGEDALSRVLGPARSARAVEALQGIAGISDMRELIALLNKGGA